MTCFLRSFYFFSAIFISGLFSLLMAQVPVLYGSDDLPLNSAAFQDTRIDNYNTGHGSNVGYTASAAAGWCQTVETDIYFGFVANDDGRVVYDVEWFNCYLGKGLEIGVYDASNTPVENCIILPVRGGFEANNLAPGNCYFIRIDGFEGDECEFFLNMNRGISMDSRAGSDCVFTTTSSVENPEASQVLQVYRDGDRLMLTTNSPDPVTASLIDPSGRRVAKVSACTDCSFDVRHLPAGIYTIMAQSRDGLRTSRWMLH